MKYKTLIVIFVATTMQITFPVWAQKERHEIMKSDQISERVSTRSSKKGSTDKAPSCLDRGLVDFVENKGVSSQWNTWVTNQLPQNFNLNVQAFEASACDNWLNGTVYANKNITYRFCNFSPPTPVVSGTNVDYGASGNNPARVIYQGCIPPSDDALGCDPDNPSPCP